MAKIIKKRQPNRSLVGDMCVYLLLLFFGFVMFLPMVYVVSNAFKPLDELFRFPPKFIVVHPTFDNFKDLFIMMGKSTVPFTRYLFNTVFITAVGTVGHLFIASLAAYVLSKYDFPGGNLFFSLVVTALMFSPEVLNIPNYLVMARLHWIDSYLAVVIPAFAMPMGLFLMKQFMEGIPMALIEAAKIDGASEFRVYVTIILPMVKPALLTAMIFAIQRLWNERGSTFIYSEQLKTLPYALGQITASGVARAGVGGAVSLFLMIVPIGIFVLAQSNIIETMASSGIKD
ncbi:MAG: carbohydrate ABC transporter permease [Lachnospiraceae bacterium]|nr:carbohydrate ABC transporter permease [Lachnospiraceae bacterium]